MTLEELYGLLRSSHVQTQGIVDTLQEPLVVLDQGLTVINANPAFYRTFRTEREATLGKSLFDLGNGQWDIPQLRELLGDVVPKAAAIVGYEVSHVFPTLGERTMLVSARRLSHPDDNSTQMLVVFEDVTAQQQADAAKDILIAETRHRMRNLMAMVRAVARQTKAEGLTGPQYRDIFMGRFEAVLTAQEFIAANPGSAVDLAALVDQALQPLAGPGVALTPSPEVCLSHHQVLPVSMILHELATNALKYGALSNGGTVHIGWNTEQRDGQSHLLLDWREQGGPPVSPPSRRGFGTDLIEFSSKAEGGEAVFNYDPAGLQVRITFPVKP